MMAIVWWMNDTFTDCTKPMLYDDALKMAKTLQQQGCTAIVYKLTETHYFKACT